MYSKSNRENGMKKLLLTLLMAFGLLLSSNAHPFYVSITEAKYNPASKSFELSIKCFADDTEAAIRVQGANNFALSKKLSASELEVFKSYVLDRIEFKGDKKVFDEKFIGYEIENDVVFIYVEIKLGKKPFPMEVSNTLLLDYQESQENIMHFQKGELKESLRMNYKTRVGKLEFKQ